MLCPLWLRINESVDGNSIFKPRWWGCICKSVDGDRIFEPRWWGNSVDGDSVIESRWWDYICNSVDGDRIFESRWLGSIYNFAFESFDGDSIDKPRWWGCIYNFVLWEKHEEEKYGVKFVRLVCAEKLLKAVINDSNKCDYRLSVRSFVKQRNWKRCRNICEPSRIKIKRIVQNLRNRKVRKEIKNLVKKSVPKSSRIYKLLVNYKADVVQFLQLANCFFSCLKQWFRSDRKVGKRKVRAKVILSILQSHYDS